MPKTALVIHNPVSGNKKLKNIPALIRRSLQKYGYTFTWIETTPKGPQAYELLLKKRALFNRILVIGGDGTVAEVASFLIQNKIKTPLAIIPTGSANILSKALKYPLLNLNRIIKLSLTETGKPIDALLINQKYHGLIAVGSGYDVILMKHTTRPLKRRLGFFAYVWVFLRTFFTTRPHRYKLTIDGKRHQILAKSVLAINALPFTDHPLSKHLPLKNIHGNDGLLNIFALNPRSLWNLLSRKPKIHTFTGKSIVIKPEKAKFFQIDGDVYKGKTVRIDVLKNALNVVQK